MRFLRKVAPLAALLMAASLSLGACSSSDNSDQSQSSSGAPYVDRDPSGNLPEVAGDAGTEPTIETVDAEAPENITVKLLDEGSGAEVTADDLVCVEYAGFLWDDGTMFDSSYSSTDVAIFSLNYVIEGWKWGLAGQHVGDRVELIVPAEYGYGDEAYDSIPASSVLVFVVEIISAQSVDLSELGEAELTGLSLPDGIAVDGELGEQAVLAFEDGAETPTTSTETVIAEGTGQTITESDYVIYHYTGTYWGDNSGVYGTWGAGPLVTAAADSAMLGYSVGSRILYVFAESGDAQVMVVDLVGVYSGATSSTGAE